MSTTGQPRTGTSMPNPELVHPELVAPETGAQKVARYTMAAARISLGTKLSLASIPGPYTLAKRSALVRIP